LGVAELHAYRDNGRHKPDQLERDITNFNVKLQSYQLARAKLDRDIVEFQERAQALQALYQDLQQ
jgi:hypothetical protein